MKAFVYHGPWSAQLGMRAAPTIGASDDVIVKICASGICGTDLGIVAGEYHATPGTILGHEASGVVALAGADAGFAVEQRVVIDPTYFCGLCRMCRTNRRNHCEKKSSTETGVTSNGTFAGYYRGKSSFLRHLPDHVSFEEASFIEPLSCALTGAKQLRLRSDHRVAVVGCGSMGLLYAWLLHLHGCRGWLVERSTERITAAEQVFPPGWRAAVTVEDVIQAYPASDGALDIIVDTTASVVGDILPEMARGGQALVVGLRNVLSKPNMGMIANRSLSVVGSIDSEDNSFDEALSLIENGAIPVGRFITHTFPLESIEEGFSILGCDIRKGVRTQPQSAIKVIIKP
jgi:threonine dehydrogenase-like Zn-dependent dehydrogenase